MTDIWLINHHATTKGRHTNISRELVNKGNTVKLFASSFKHNVYKELKDYPEGKNYLKEKEENYERVWIKTPPYDKNGFKRLINQLVFAYRVIKTGLNMKSPDVIIGSSVHLFAGLAAYILAKIKKVPFIFEVRDLWPQTLVDLDVLNDKSPVTYLFRWLEKFLYKKADKIISVLPRGVDYISSLGIKEEKVIHIPNGVDLTWFDRHINTELENKELINFFNNQKDMVFAYTGAHGLANGLITLVKSAKIIQDRNIRKNIQFLLVGDGPEKEKLIKEAKRLELNNITFIPRVDKDQVPAILNKADVCVSIVRKSKVHKYGVSMNKIFDYLASGKPMISALEAAFDFADVADCGIALPPDDPPRLANAVVEMSEISLEDREELGKNGRQFVEENNDYPILAGKLIKVIEEVCR
ncbi:glycosyltransferase family 4 protein [Acetohalobium arabaticum]|uniref:Glycosyl transferase group 1 n=1 Tax=Acetohalobium arabaticum (strain ATCC 49924 / DSM 5501 / Z-7288) TaxID=574087 RepID=D9QTA5_ACEAZ|nr:glycosyltransferase family 4 protein [Acetohalobium arabaticum]ADL13605.1 glycosyl transferase group 1 [Acetohalobium arabaticum DSM 5501]